MKHAPEGSVDAVCSVLSKNSHLLDEEKYTNAFLKKHTDSAPQTGAVFIKTEGKNNKKRSSKSSKSSSKYGKLMFPLGVIKQEHDNFQLARKAQLWNKLEDICAEGSASFSLHTNRPLQEENHPDHSHGLGCGQRQLSPFAVRKVIGCIRRTSPLWVNVDQKKSIFRAGQNQEKMKHIYYRLGDGLLQLLCYMAVVKSHLSGDSDGLFVARLAQVLIEQSERDIMDSESEDIVNSQNIPQHHTSSDNHSSSNSSTSSTSSTRPGPTVSQLCISYLESMNINVLRAVRIANILVAKEVNPQVSPLVTCTLPDDEALLLSSATLPLPTLTGKKRVARTYRPV